MGFLSKRSVVVVAVVAASLSAPETRAASIIKDPNPPKYSIELEPHLNVGLSQFEGTGYKGFGVGPGMRFGINLGGPLFVPKINDSIAISFGPDIIRYSYETCRGGIPCDSTSTWSLYFPVALQWNFWLTENWSVFGEPGLTPRRTFYDCPAGAFCPNKDKIFPSFFAGARYHFGDTLALTLRAGYPMGVSIGLSIF